MVGLEGTPRIMKLQPPPQAGPPTSTFHTSPGCPGPIQPGLEHLQGWMGHPQPLWAAVPLWICFKTCFVVSVRTSPLVPGKKGQRFSRITYNQPFLQANAMLAALLVLKLSPDVWGAELDSMHVFKKHCVQEY